MELIFGLLVIGVLIWLITRKSSSDKLTLLSFENWMEIYDKASDAEKNRMATAFIVQSLNIAKETHGVNIRQFMMEKTKNKFTSQQVFDYWMHSWFQSEDHESYGRDLLKMEARRAGAVLYLIASA
ncbi:hypothetical protein CGX12_05045 [Zobellella denitrificans]|uniref:hypothetical protein n=1 Tax=Zobellella denitrificans TaxID=347534 RepID=UPI000B8C0E61|nr:hypothetical protein [Zobellella denitrificans]OXS16189.1 hypothetical protein CGX12_05045 [Zobellella denitrificans]